MKMLRTQIHPHTGNVVGMRPVTNTAVHVACENVNVNVKMRM